MELPWFTCVAQGHHHNGDQASRKLDIRSAVAILGISKKCCTTVRGWILPAANVFLKRSIVMLRLSPLVWLKFERALGRHIFRIGGVLELPLTANDVYGVWAVYRTTLSALTTARKIRYDKRNRYRRAAYWSTSNTTCINLFSSSWVYYIWSALCDSCGIAAIFQRTL